MKELSLEKMETLQGGDYCDDICYWFNGGPGYQGDYYLLYYCATAFCGNCH